jgi:ribosomal protein S18 acetylase RimI-like enzyme
VKPVTLRTATGDDVDAAARLERSSFDAFQLDQGRLAYLVRSPRSIVRVAECGGHVVGHAVSLIRRGRGMTWGRLYSIAVDPACRGTGIGRRLLEDAMARLAKGGATRVLLEVERTNAAAVGLYERSGFCAVETLADFYGPGRDGVRMTRDLVVSAVRPAA